jgi:hypothetical protein
MGVNVSLVGVADEKGVPAINGSGHGSVVVINIDGVISLDLS